MIEYILICAVLGIPSIVWYIRRNSDSESDSDTCSFHSDGDFDLGFDLDSDSDSPLSDINADVWTDNHNRQRHRSSHRRSARIAERYKPNYPYVLIIIDMQNQFAASRDKMTIQTIQRLVAEAKRDGAFILAAHYMRFGKTRADIRDMITDYPHKDYCYADRDDKSGTIQTKLVRHDVRTDTFKVCGVNTGACVRATTIGLVDLYPNTHILVSNRACNCNCDQAVTCDGHYVGRLPNVSFIH